MNTKKKAVRLTKFERTKKWDYFSVKSLLKKNQETGSMDSTEFNSAGLFLLKTTCI